MRTKVLHIINNTHFGGAEIMLLKLLAHRQHGTFEHEVISLKGIGPIGEEMLRVGVPVRALELNGIGEFNPFRWARLVRWIREIRPDVVQTWMYHADLGGGLAARCAGSSSVIWNLRHAETAGLSWRTRWLPKLSAWLSPQLPAKIVANSETARRAHAALGYDSARLTVIANGFETDVFRPDPETRREVRRELGIASAAPVVGVIGRFHADKDHHTFLRAAAIVARQRPEVRFVLIGRDVTPDNPQLMGWIRELQLDSACLVVGARKDIPRCLAALDVLVSPSATESFPNIVGEAMACGVPCAVTDVGDCRQLLGDDRWLAPPRDAACLARHVLTLLALPAEQRRQLSAQLRARVIEKYDIPHIVAQYDELWRSCLPPHNALRLRQAA